MTNYPPIRFSSGFFSRSKLASEKSQIPPSLAFSPFSGESPDNCELPACKRCGSYLVPGTDGFGYSECAFCGSSAKNPSFRVMQISEWQISSTVKPRTVFLIDNSSSSKCSNFLRVVLDTIRSVFPQSTTTNVAFMALSDQLMFLLPNNSVSVISDMNDFIIPPNAFLKTMPESFEPLIKARQSERGPDVYAALDAISRQIGQSGHIYLFVTTPPAGEVSFSRVNIETENASLKGANYNEKFQQIVKNLDNQSAFLDVFVYSLVQRLIDCGTFGKMCAQLGGRIAYANPTMKYSLQNEIAKFLNGFDAVCSLKISNGCKILPSLGEVHHHPNSFKLTAPQSHVFPIVLPQNFQYSTNSNGTTENEIYVQAVVKYRNINGEYWQRVYTYSAGLTDDPAIIFKSADCGVLLKYITNSLLNLFFSENVLLSNLKDCALALLKPIFFCFRYHISRNPNRFINLVMPKTLQLLPRYVLGIVKSTAFVSGISFDERSSELVQLGQKSPEELLAIANPELYEISDFLNNTGDLKPLKCTEAELKTDRILLLYNGFSTYLWLGEKLDKDLCKRTFNKPSSYLIDVVQPIDTEESKRLYSLIKGVLRTSYETKPGAQIFLDRLIEDYTSTKMPSYHSWLNDLHMISLPKDGH